jgi:hypothetical protein
MRPQVGQKCVRHGQTPQKDHPNVMGRQFSRLAGLDVPASTSRTPLAVDHQRRRGFSSKIENRRPQKSSPDRSRAPAALQGVQGAYYWFARCALEL